VKKSSRKTGTNHQGEQYLNQYFKQTKNTNVLHANNNHPLTQFQSKKFSQVESPKDSSIERARQDDILS
jgi:hypothetical protein